LTWDQPAQVILNKLTDPSRSNNLHLREQRILKEVKDATTESS
jgi:hypothetical protein